MKPRSLLVVPSLVLAAGLAACDGRSYEAEVTALSEELSATQAELDAAISENERLRAELEQTSANAPSGDAEDPAAGSVGGEAEDSAVGNGAGGGGQMAPALSDAVEGELEAMTEKLTVALTSLSEIEAQTENGELRAVRENLQEAVGSAQTILTVVGGQETAPDASDQDESAPEVMESDQEPAQQ